jgi:hypothetical protein
MEWSSLGCHRQGGLEAKTKFECCPSSRVKVLTGMGPISPGLRHNVWTHTVTETWHEKRWPVLALAFDLFESWPWVHKMHTYCAGHMLCGSHVRAMSGNFVGKLKLQVCWINSREKPKRSGPPAFGVGFKSPWKVVLNTVNTPSGFHSGEKCFWLAGRLLAFQEGLWCMQQLIRRCNPCICPSACLNSKRFD